MQYSALSTGLGEIRMLGRNDTLIWGMTNAERVRRLSEKAAQAGQKLPPGKTLFVSLDFVFDPLLFAIALERPGVAIMRDGAFVLGLLPQDADPQERAPEGAVERLEIRDGDTFYNRQLRKLQQPFVSRLTPENVPMIERQSYQGAYKGVTDILTKYLWPEWALFLTRLSARIGITPNMVTAIGALFNVLAMIAFWNGRYWSGMAFALAFMVLDTVDGKLARCTITSTGWGEVFDHGIDLLHPPFWWWAWGVGLSAVGLGLPTDQFVLIMALVVAGYVLQRGIEGIFLKRFGMDIHVWDRIDSHFRLITARRNPNMVILFVSMLFGRPDLGLIAITAWTVLSCIFHAVRLAQAELATRRGKPVVSWMG
jgi:phosphatidylglycerophosphate synthase